MIYIVLVAAVAVLGAFIVPMVLAYRLAGSRARDAPSSAGHVVPRVIQNSTVAYGIGLATLAPLLGWGVSGELWSVVAYLASIGLGLSLVYVLRRPMLQFLEGALGHDRSITVHEFISWCHGNDPRVRALAAALTVFAIYGLIVCDMIGLATVLKPIFSGSRGGAELFVAAIFSVVATCTLCSGNLGFLHATQLQLGLIFFGLFGSTALLLYLQVSAVGAMPARGIVALALIAVICAVVHLRRRARYLDTSFIRPNTTSAAALRDHEPASLRLSSRLLKILNSVVGVLAVTLVVLATIVTALELFVEGAPSVARDGLKMLRTGTSLSEMTLISLVLLPLFHPIVDVVNWQRVAAFARSRDWNYFKDGEWTAAFKNFGVTYAVEVPLIALLIFLFGAVAGLTLAAAPEGDAARVFVASLLAQDNSVATAVLALLMFGLFALAVTTMGSLFSAGLYVVSCDIVPTLRPELTSTARCAADGRPTRRTLIVGLVMGLSVLTTFLLADARFAHGFGVAGLLGAIFGFSSAQMAFAPLVLAPLFAGTARFATVTPAWAFAVLVVGAAIGIGMTITGLVLGYESVLSWAVPACLGSATLMFVIAAFSTRRTAAPG